MGEWQRLDVRRPPDREPVLLWCDGLYDVGWLDGDMLVRNQAGAPVRVFTGWWWTELPAPPSSEEEAGSGNRTQRKETD